MPKLNDAHRVLLSNASERDSGSVLRLPAYLADAGDRADKAIAALIKLGCVGERETTDTAYVHRTDGDICFGLYITDIGAAAIGACAVVVDRSSTSPAQPARTSKSASVIALLERDAGATLSESIDATGWLPHTTFGQEGACDRALQARR